MRLFHLKQEYPKILSKDWPFASATSIASKDLVLKSSSTLQGSRIICNALSQCRSGRLNLTDFKNEMLILLIGGRIGSYAD